MTVLFGLGVWTAFTAGMRHGRAVERARADRQIHDTALPALNARTDTELPPEQRTALREAIGEALRNTAQHSGIREAEVTVETRNGGVTVTAQDTGAGFDLNSCHPGFGIGESIVARISEVGGTATIESQPGAGTRVTLWVPV